MLMMNQNWSQSAREKRLCRQTQPYLDQWWRETQGYKMVSLGDDPISETAETVMNFVGQVGVGINTILDRTVDRLANPQRPVELAPDALLPRTQRDTIQLLKGVFSKEALKHPIGTALSSTMRVFGIGTSFLADGFQKVGGGKNLAA